MKKTPALDWVRLDQSAQTLMRQRGLMTFVIGLCAAFLFLAFQGQPVLFDWDELIYASLARQMVVSGDWLSLIINGDPFWEKPPLFMWLQAMAFSWGGLSETTARLPSALASGMTVSGLYGVGVYLWGPALALLWSILLCTSFLPLWFGKTGLIDPLLNLLMLMGLGGLFFMDQQISKEKKGVVPLLIAAVALGLAVLTKGPLGWGLPMIIWVLYKCWHRRPYPQLWQVALFLLISGGVACSWFILELWFQGPDFVVEFSRYQWRILTRNDGHPGPIYFHILAYGLGCFPFAFLSVGALGSTLWRRHPPQLTAPTEQQQAFLHLSIVAIAVVLAVFSLLVQTKLIHYTSLLYPLGSFWAALRLHQFLQKQATPSFLEIAGILCTGLFWLFLLTLVPWLGRHPSLLKTWIQDPLTLGYLRAPVAWPLWSFLPALFLMIGLLSWWMSLNQRSLWAWMLLLGFSGLTAQSVWLGLAPHLLLHAQGGAIQFFQTQDQTTAPLILYGYRSYIPYFYGPLHVPYAATVEELQTLLKNEPAATVITWIPFESELSLNLSLFTLEKHGAFLKMVNQP
ncbi:MAG: phospholipid carrier-dependent glycosyltransferase [Synechococcaceae cyanobacterium SM2_3_1]|nr:phospholipid carrier-dependent glycosyltransferase [Synechococcaceae cyanobacterium SM2_3_1]